MSGHTRQEEEEKAYQATQDKKRRKRHIRPHKTRRGGKGVSSHARQEGEQGGPAVGLPVR